MFNSNLVTDISITCVTYIEKAMRIMEPYSTQTARTYFIEYENQNNIKGQRKM